VLHKRNGPDRVQLLFSVARSSTRDPQTLQLRIAASSNGSPGPATAMRFLGEPFRHDLFVSFGHPDFEVPVDG
jgi:hypothetical protein